MQADLCGRRGSFFCLNFLCAIWNMKSVEYKGIFFFPSTWISPVAPASRRLCVACLFLFNPRTELTAITFWCSQSCEIAPLVLLLSPAQFKLGGTTSPGSWCPLYIFRLSACRMLCCFRCPLACVPPECMLFLELLLLTAHLLANSFPNYSEASMESVYAISCSSS